MRIQTLNSRFICSVALYPSPPLQLIMEEEQGSPDYRFLFDLTTKEHIYYRQALGQGVFCSTSSWCGV